MKILVLNAGSSSQKSALYEVGETLPKQAPEPLWQAYVEWSGKDASAKLVAMTATGARAERESPAGDRDAIIRAMLETLWSGPTRVIRDGSEIGVVGHRVVHGGPDFSESARVTPEVRAAIERLAEFAPLHNPPNLEGIAAIERALGDVPQVAVFDTAFHAHLPEVAKVYPGPYAWYEQGIRRYGFHGTSHQYCAERAAALLGRDPASLRLITCHLGSGCSLAAIRDGRSVDTTMGFTPLEGLMMGSRSGSVDPGILTYLLREKGATAESLDDTLNHQSGLKGISGISSDIRDVLAARERGNARAALAFDLFVYRLRLGIGAMLAALGGANALVFTGGIGEHVAAVRSAACAALGYAGVALDEERNAASPVDADVASEQSRVRVLVIHTEEDWMIARDCWRLMREGSSNGGAG